MTPGIGGSRIAARDFGQGTPCDYDGKRLFVRQSVWHTYTTSPKTEDAASLVPVIETLAEFLARLREADCNPSSGPILRGPSGKAVNLDNLSKWVMIPLLHGCTICRKLKTEHTGEDRDFVRDAALPSGTADILCGAEWQPRLPD